MNTFRNEYFRLRPSVSLAPVKDKNIYQFFLSDIRASFSIRFECDTYINILRTLDGTLPFKKIVEQYSLSDKEKEGLHHLINILIKKCVVEDVTVVRPREDDEFRRVKNFIASYIPYHSVEYAWEHFSNSHVVLTGAGAIGSWVALLLSQMGLKNFTLIDNDIVKRHNLNRSIFTISDIGQLKTHCIAKYLYSRKNNFYNISIQNNMIRSSAELQQTIKAINNTSIAIINCADSPSVAETSALINDTAFALQIPYIISGGYNMHLSLIGPTVIPHLTPCVHCISHGMNQVKFSEIENAERVVKEHRNLGNLAPLAAISASFAANECLKLFLNLPNLMPTMAGKRGEFNFYTKELILEEYDIWKNCPYCSSM